MVGGRTETEADQLTLCAQLESDAVPYSDCHLKRCIMLLFFHPIIKSFRFCSGADTGNHFLDISPPNRIWRRADPQAGSSQSAKSHLAAC